MATTNRARSRSRGIVTARRPQAFAPDFYLPTYDLYIEITTLNQKLVTKKNRKARPLPAVPRRAGPRAVPA